MQDVGQPTLYRFSFCHWSALALGTYHRCDRSPFRCIRKNTLYIFQNVMRLESFTESIFSLSEPKAHQMRIRFLKKLLYSKRKHSSSTRTRVLRYHISSSIQYANIKFNFVKTEKLFVEIESPFLGSRLRPLIVSFLSAHQNQWLLSGQFSCCGRAQCCIYATEHDARIAI